MYISKGAYPELQSISLCNSEDFASVSRKPILFERLFGFLFTYFTNLFCPMDFKQNLIWDALY